MIEQLSKYYEVVNYKNAAGVLQTGCLAELQDLVEAFTSVRISTHDLIAGGGNECNIPKKYSAILRDKGWRETRISGDLLVKVEKDVLAGV